MSLSVAEVDAILDELSTQKDLSANDLVTLTNLHNLNTGQQVKYNTILDNQDTSVGFSMLTGTDEEPLDVPMDVDKILADLESKVSLTDEDEEQIFELFTLNLIPNLTSEQQEILDTIVEKISGGIDSRGFTEASEQTDEPLNVDKILSELKGKEELDDTDIETLTKILKKNPTEEQDDILMQIAEKHDNFIDIYTGAK